jgi:GDP-mannose 6-dehydrogenase
MLVPFSRKKIGLVGLSFKADTDDIRESPAVALVQKLVRRKFKVKVYDRSFSPQSIYGSNRAFLKRFLPNFSRLWVSELDTLLQQVDVIVLTQSLSEEQKERVRQSAKGRVVVDFARVFEPGELEGTEYRGICW